MRELEGTGIVHRSDSDFMPKVVETIQSARRAKDARAFIDLLNGAKPYEYAIRASDDAESRNHSTMEMPHEENIEEMER